MPFSNIVLFGGKRRCSMGEFRHVAEVENDRRSLCPSVDKASVYVFMWFLVFMSLFHFPGTLKLFSIILLFVTFTQSHISSSILFWNSTLSAP